MSEQSLPRLPDLKSFNAWSVRKSSFGPLERDACHRLPVMSALGGVCPLWAKSRHSRAKCHVRFTPESGHWRCTNQCPL